MKLKDKIVLNDKQKAQLTNALIKLLEKLNTDLLSQFGTSTLTENPENLKKLDTFLHDLLPKLMEDIKNIKHNISGVKHKALYAKLSVNIDDEIIDNLNDEEMNALVAKHAPDFHAAMKLKCFLDLREGPDGYESIFDYIKNDISYTMVLDNGSEVTISKNSSFVEANKYFQEQFDQCHTDYPDSTKYDTYISSFETSLLAEAHEFVSNNSKEL